MRIQIQVIVFLSLFLGNAACSDLPKNIPISKASLGSCTENTSPEPEPSAVNIIFTSEDDGLTWEDVSDGLPKAAWGVGRVLVSKNEIVLATGDGLYRKNQPPMAQTWEKAQFLTKEVSNVYEGKNGVYASSYGKGLYQEVAGTGAWANVAANLEDKEIRTMLETTEGNLLVGCETGLFKTADRGKTWKKVAAGVGINGLAQAGGALVCSNFEGMMRSDDGGETWQWTDKANGQGFNTKTTANGVVTITDGLKKWGESGFKNRLLYSADAGKTWGRIDQNLIFTKEIYDCVQAGNHLFASTDVGISRSADNGKTWELVRSHPENDQNRFVLAVLGKRVFVVSVFGC